MRWVRAVGAVVGARDTARARLGSWGEVGHLR